MKTKRKMRSSLMRNENPIFAVLIEESDGRLRYAAGGGTTPFATFTRKQDAWKFRRGLAKYGIPMKTTRVVRAWLYAETAGVN